MDLQQPTTYLKKNCENTYLEFNLQSFQEATTGNIELLGARFEKQDEEQGKEKKRERDTCFILGSVEMNLLAIYLSIKPGRNNQFCSGSMALLTSLFDTIFCISDDNDNRNPIQKGKEGTATLCCT
mgnify:CR=1 FL=1